MFNENPFESSGYGEWPHSITSITEIGAILLLSFAGHGSTMVGGPSASVRRYRAKSLIFDANLDELASDRVSKLTLNFPSIGQWSGLNAANEHIRTATNGLARTYTVELSAEESFATEVDGGYRISVSAHWAVKGPTDRRILHTPTAISIESKRPRPVEELRILLRQVHGLLCMAYSGYILAADGTAAPHLKVGTRTTEYWDQSFMARPSPAPIPNLDFPRFTLATIGGIGSLRRWSRLCNSHPRAIEPLIGPYTHAERSVPVRMLEVASAIEYWVNSHKRVAAWAKSYKPPSLALARHVGKSFADWTGNSERWATQFWDTYNALKHEPNSSVDLRWTSILADSGELLLKSAILDRIALNKAPSNLILGGSVHDWQLRDSVRKMISIPYKTAPHGKRRKR